MNHVIEHCGNFSMGMLPGMIGYGRETDKGRGRRNASGSLFPGDGYATKEGDILLGGFIMRKAAQRAWRDGRHLHHLGVAETEKLALAIATQHVREHGTVGREHYHRWMVRAKTFARHHGIEMPPQNRGERDHLYFRRIRQWVKGRPEKWPELQPAVGTHLVFSPDPKIWTAIRAAGLDERIFLRNILTRTMKEFSDWRRKQTGLACSLGWVAGTHVSENGADGHPHAHLVVLKRDEAGKEVDWSVSQLKGHRGRQTPDPLHELKRLFGKCVEKEIERTFGAETLRHLLKPHVVKEPARIVPQRPPALRHAGLRRLAHGLRAAFRAMQPYHRFPSQTEMGRAMRLVALASRSGSVPSGRSNKYVGLPDLKTIVAEVRRALAPTLPSPSYQ